jgi:hypothetical protein
MNIKRNLIRCAIAAVLIAALGISLELYGWRKGPFGEESKLAADIQILNST